MEAIRKGDKDMIILRNYYRITLNLIHILINFILTDFEIVTMKFPYEVPESQRRNKKS